MKKVKIGKRKGAKKCVDIDLWREKDEEIEIEKEKRMKKCVI